MLFFKKIEIFFLGIIVIKTYKTYQLSKNLIKCLWLLS